MASLKDIKLRIKSVISTQKTTRAMKMVSAAKLRRAQDAIIKFRPYAGKMNDVLKRLIASLEGASFSTPFAPEGRAQENVLVVVVTSNRGLAGSFNNAIARVAEEHINNELASFKAAGKLEVLTIGKKGYEYFKKRGYKLVGENHDVFADLSFEAVQAVAQLIMDGYLAGTWDRVELVYNEFKTVIAQIRRVETYLPVEVSADAEDAAPADYIYEPEQAEILNDLIPRIIQMRLYRAVLESHAAEHGARMVAMDNATENAQELLGNLRLSYNKARQAAITTEIIEIVSGANALEQS